MDSTTLVYMVIFLESIVFLAIGIFKAINAHNRNIKLEKIYGVLAKQQFEAGVPKKDALDAKTTRKAAKLEKLRRELELAEQEEEN